jgi:protease-4
LSGLPFTADLFIISNMTLFKTGSLIVAIFMIVGVTLAAPSTQPTDPNASIRDLAKRIRQLNDQPEKPAKVACFDLATGVVEKPSDFSLLGGDASAVTLQSLIDRLHHARDDKEVRVVLLKLGSPGTNLSQSQEIRDALVEIRKVGKKVFVYADEYDTDTYTIATGATNICILPGGGVEIPGVSIETMYLKNLFDKLGVKADYVQIGDYKGADEEFTRTGPSPEFRGELNKLMDGLYQQVITGISVNRNLPEDQVKGILDDAILSAQSAKDRGLVDHLVDVDGLHDLIGDEMAEPVKFAEDYDAPGKEAVDLSSPFALFSMFMKKPETSSKPAVAIVFVDGVIVDGGLSASLLDGETIGADTIRQAMRNIATDDSIKCVVIRINSPGGSALASEAMWQAVRRVAAKKPVVISIGNMAASGGYYLASAGDRIFADPSAIVGSIGVVGGKFVTKDLFDKLGITTESFHRGHNADLFGSDAPFTDHQRKMVKSWMTETYDQFIARVMTTRGGKIKKIEDVAQGRVFIAEQAKDIGMVDEIGGVGKAIVYAAGQAQLKPGYDVRIVPAPRTLADLLTGNGLSTAAPIQPKVEISDTSILRAMPQALRSMVGEELQILQLLQDRPVVLVAPFAVREK